MADTVKRRPRKGHSGPGLRISEVVPVKVIGGFDGGNYVRLDGTSATRSKTKARRLFGVVFDLDNLESTGKLESILGSMDSADKSGSQKRTNATNVDVREFLRAVVGSDLACERGSRPLIKMTSCRTDFVQPAPPSYKDGADSDSSVENLDGKHSAHKTTGPEDRNHRHVHRNKSGGGGGGRKRGSSSSSGRAETTTGDKSTVIEEATKLLKREKNGASAAPRGKSSQQVQQAHSVTTHVPSELKKSPLIAHSATHLFPTAPANFMAHGAQLYNITLQRVVVIGGGIAGIACALELQRFGFETILLEAQDKVGGRCRTLEGKGVDAGAMWVHGFDNNPIIRELYNHGLGWAKFNHRSCVFNEVGYKIGRDVYRQAEEICTNWMRGNVTLEEISRSDDEDLKAAIGWWKAYNEYSVGTELENIDLREWDQDDQYEFRGGHCLVANGYQQLVERMGAGVKTLQLAHRVNKVQIRSAVELLAPGRSRNDDGKQIHGLYDADGNRLTPKQLDEQQLKYGRWWRCITSTVRYRSSKDVGDLHTPHISVRKNEYVYAQLNEGTKISELWLQAYDRFLPYGFEEEDAFFEEVDSSELIEDEIGWYRCCFRGRGVTVRHSMAFDHIKPGVVVLKNELVAGKAVKNQPWVMVDYRHFIPLRHRGEELFRAISDTAVRKGKFPISAFSSEYFSKWIRQKPKPKKRSQSKKGSKSNANTKKKKPPRRSVLVETESLDTHESTKIEADAVVCTLPLGVLKDQSKKGRPEFSPALPPEKEKAIAELGYGVLDKIILEFPFAFWEEDDSNAGSLVGKACCPQAKHSLDPKKQFGYFNYAALPRGKFYHFINMNALNPDLRRPVLVTITYGEFAKLMERLTQSEAVAACMKTLQKMFGKDIPAPTFYQVTAWHSNPFIRGSYSFIRKGSSGEIYDALAAPTHNLSTFYAGEATNRRWPATVHGAYISGVREARRIAGLWSAALWTLRENIDAPLQHSQDTAASRSASTNSSSRKRKLPAETGTTTPLQTVATTKWGSVEATDLLVYHRSPIASGTIGCGAVRCCLCGFGHKTKAGAHYDLGDMLALLAPDDKAEAGRSSASKNTSVSTSRVGAAGKRARANSKSAKVANAAVDDVGIIQHASCYIHENCALYSPQVWYETEGTLKFRKKNTRNARGAPVSAGDADDPRAKQKSKPSGWRNVRRTIILGRQQECCAGHNGSGASSCVVEQHAHTWASRRSKSFRGYFSDDSGHASLTQQQALAAIRRGATIHCHAPDCSRWYHLPCAKAVGRFAWDFQRPDQGKFFLCPEHRGEEAWATVPPPDATLPVEKATVESILHNFVNVGAPGSRKGRNIH